MDKATRIQRARTLRAEGLKLSEIAEALGVSVATAWADCKGAFPKGTVAVSPEKRARMDRFASLYCAGKPVPEIADELGVPAGTLYDWRRTLNLPKNPRSAYFTDDMRRHLSRKFSRDPDGSLKAEAVRLYQEEEQSSPEIAKELGVTSVTVTEWLKAEGIDIRRSPTERHRKKLSQALQGERAHNWKGGLTPEQMRRRGSVEMRIAREACFERDDYTCRMCKQRGGRLNAHHIYPFHRHPERQFDPKNLMTLCADCHNRFHKSAGGHVKPAYGPFFPEEGSEDWARDSARSLGDEVKEAPACYDVSRLLPEYEGRGPSEYTTH